jgi:hypothetical protein
MMPLNWDVAPQLVEGGDSSGLDPWEAELESLTAWKGTLGTNLKNGLPDDCNTALSTLNEIETPSRKGQPSISAAGLTEALNRVEFKNGVGSTDLYMNLFPGKSAPSASMAVYTVGQDFANNPGQTALAALGGSAVYFRPGTGATSATIMHELLHNLGLEDTDIMTALGLKGASVEISNFLWEKCLKPPVSLLW